MTAEAALQESQGSLSDRGQRRWSPSEKAVVCNLVKAESARRHQPAKELHLHVARCYLLAQCHACVMLVALDPSWLIAFCFI